MPVTNVTGILGWRVQVGWTGRGETAALRLTPTPVPDPFCQAASDALLIARQAAALQAQPLLDLLQLQAEVGPLPSAATGAACGP